MLRIQTQEHIKSLTDVDLIAYSRDADYEPEAIAFAHAEIQRRNLNSAEHQLVLIAADELFQSREAERAAAATRPLGCWGRILAFLGGYFFIGLLVPPLLAAGYFANRGERAKRRDVLVFILSGFGATLLSIRMPSIFDVVRWLAPIWLGGCALGIAGIVVFAPKAKSAKVRGFAVRMENET
jgi:hypothetical protein